MSCYEKACVGIYGVETGSFMVANAEPPLRRELR